jgi:hypothetical protein
MADREIELVPASTISPKAVKWLWDGRIPQGSISLLAGVEGMGKGNVLSWIAARLTRGELEGDLLGVPTNVAIVSSEDGLDETLMPRLAAADADLQRATFIKMHADGKPTGGLTLPADSDLLRDACVRNHIALVVIDPINAFLDLRANSHNDHSIRGALGPIAEVAMAGNFAVLGVMHLNKSQSVQERNALMGSVAYRAAARSTLIVGLDPDDPDEHGDGRVLVHGKHNLSKRQVGHRFRICETVVQDQPRITATRADMGEAVWFTVEEVLQAGQPVQRERVTPALDEAVEFLERELLAGPRPTSEVQQLALLRGIKPATLTRARKKVGVRSRVEDFQGVWHLELPPARVDQEVQSRSS